MYRNTMRLQLIHAVTYSASQKCVQTFDWHGIWSKYSSQLIVSIYIVMTIECSFFKYNVFHKFFLSTSLHSQSWIYSYFIIPSNLLKESRGWCIYAWLSPLIPSYQWYILRGDPLMLEVCLWQPLCSVPWWRTAHHCWWLDHEGNHDASTAGRLPSEGISDHFGGCGGGWIKEDSRKIKCIPFYPFKCPPSHTEFLLNLMANPFWLCSEEEINNCGKMGE